MAKRKALTLIFKLFLFFYELRLFSIQNSIPMETIPLISRNNNPNPQQQKILSLNDIQYILLAI